MIIYDGNNPVMGLIVAIGVLLVVACVIVSVISNK